MRLGIVLLVISWVGAENVEIEDLDVAITTAKGGEEFAVSAGTYTKNVDFNYEIWGIVIEGKAMSIVGEGSDLSILDGGSDHQVLYVYDVTSGKVVFDGLVIRNGMGGHGGGMYNLRQRCGDEQHAD